MSDDQFSYPWTSAELVAVSLVEAAAFALRVVGLTPVMPLGVTVMGLLQIAVGVGLLTRPTPVGAEVRPPSATASIALR